MSTRYCIKFKVKFLTNRSHDLEIEKINSKLYEIQLQYIMCHKQ